MEREQLKKEDLVKGGIYFGKEDEYQSIFEFCYIEGNSTINGSHRITNEKEYKSDKKNLAEFRDELRLVTQDEKNWLNACIKAGKFVPRNKFEVGKWYENKNCNYGKYKNHDDTYFRFDEKIIDGVYNDGGGFSWGINTVTEISLEKIQQYLPDGHPDKIKKEKNWCVEVTRENKGIVHDYFKKQKGFSWDQNIGQVIGFKNDGSLRWCPKSSLEGEIPIISTEEFYAKIGHVVEVKLDDVITRAVRANDPNLIVRETGKTVEELCERMANIAGCKRGDWATWFDSYELCRGLSCGGCIFNKSLEEAQKWLRSAEARSLYEASVLALKDFQFESPIKDRIDVYMNGIQNFSDQVRIPKDRFGHSPVHHMMDFRFKAPVQSIITSGCDFASGSAQLISKSSYEDKDGILITENKKKKKKSFKIEILEGDNIVEL